jgi:hypothetical protein
MADSELRPRARVTGWGAYAALLPSVSAVVHVGTYLGLALTAYTWLFIALHLGVFPVFIALVLRSRPWQRERSGPFGLHYRQLDWREWRTFLPSWAPFLIAILGAYAIANFLFALVHLPARGTSATLTDTQEMYMARMLSGHWLVFNALPLLFFTYVPRNTTTANALSTPVA